MQTPIPLDDLRSVEDLAAEHPKVLTIPTLRYQLRNREATGMAAACVRVGKRLLISKSRYEQWLATQAAGGAHVNG